MVGLKTALTRLEGVCQNVETHHISSHTQLPSWNRLCLFLLLLIIGRPNVGKSTIVVLRAIRGERVHDEPGVTRDRTYVSLSGAITSFSRRYRRLSI